MSPNIWSSVKGVSTRLTAILESQGGVGELNMLDWTNNATYVDLSILTTT